MPFQVICSRCNKSCSESKKCERFDCELPEYFDAYAKYFPKGVPPKYYCSLTGGINSGKTYFLITLVNNLLSPDRSLKAFFIKHKIARVELIDPVSHRLYDTLLYECSMGQLKFTRDTTLTFFNLIVYLTNGGIYEIVLFNSSGEKIEKEYNSKNIRTEAHELKGSATIHFIDPREDSMLNEILERPKDNNDCSNLEIADYVHGILQYVNGGVKSINNPLAVCISKFDLLLPLVPFDVPENPFIETSQTLTFFQDIDRMSKSLTAFLDKNSQTVDPNNLRYKFSMVKYFAIAPFGSDITPAYWNQRSPKGIHAPFFWILKELKIISPENGRR